MPVKRAFARFQRKIHPPRRGATESSRGHLWQVAALLAAAAVGALATFYVGVLNYQNGVAQGAAEYIKIVGDLNQPAPARMLALTALLEKKLIDADILLDAAYAIEDQDKDFFTHQILYLLADKRIHPRCPFGHVDLLAGDSLEPMNGFYTFSGWALDDAGVEKIMLLVDGKEIPWLVPTIIDRGDIARIFYGFSNRQGRLRSGFLFRIPEAVAAGRTALLTLRVFNKNVRFRDIFNRTVRFLPAKR